MGLLDKAKQAASSAAEKAQGHRREAAAEKASAQAAGEQPLMQLKGSMVKTKEWRPNKVLIFNDRVEELDPGFLKKRMQTIRFDQVAQVGIKRGVVWSEVTIESTGGHTIVAHGLKKGEADEAKGLLDRLISGARSRSAEGPPPPAVDIPEQLRKLAELRDAGVLTAEEFEAKKAELLARM